jgi:4-hydroxy-tetrahydrodipicolinate synthase
VTLALGRGLIAAPLTVWRAGGERPDNGALEAQVELIAGRFAPVAIAVAAVEVQEYHVLSPRQRAELVRRAVARGGGVPVVGGVSDPSLSRAIELARSLADAGAAAVLAVAGLKPWGAPPTDDELVAWYEQLADASPLPVLLYANLRTGVDPSVAAMGRIAAHPNVVALKETSRDAGKLLRLCSDIDVAGHARVYSNMESLQATLAVGGSGAMMPTPPLVVADALLAALRAGDAQEAGRLQRFFADYPSRWMRLGLGPAMKASMTILGLDAGEPLAPYRDLDESERASLREYLCGWGLEDALSP